MLGGRAVPGRRLACVGWPALVLSLPVASKLPHFDRPNGIGVSAGAERPGRDETLFGPVGRPHRVLVGAVLVGLLVWLSPWQQRGSDLINDRLARWAAPAPATSGVLVVDIDEAYWPTCSPSSAPGPTGAMCRRWRWITCARRVRG